MELTIQSRRRHAAMALAAALLATVPLSAQVSDASQLAELTSLRNQIRNGNTRIRVPAMHRVWSIGRASSRTDVKIAALSLLKEPVDSSSDHIRTPAIYAVADIAVSSTDTQVKIRALEALRAPMGSEQLPVRVAAIDALNAIVRSGATRDLGKVAVMLLAAPVRSVTNGVRMPAINAMVRAVEGSQDVSAYDAALEQLVQPLGSDAPIGGMEVRLMALAAVHRIGVDATAVAVKERAVKMAQSYALGGTWKEEEARDFASDAAAAIRATIK
jgi:hypothetical protein